MHIFLRIILLFFVANLAKISAGQDLQDTPIGNFPGQPPPFLDNPSNSNALAGQKHFPKIFWNSIKILYLKFASTNKVIAQKKWKRKHIFWRNHVKIKFFMKSLTPYLSFIIFFCGKTMFFVFRILWAHTLKKWY